MLDQNTDRMWYVIGAVIVGAALIFIMNGVFPTLFANIGNTFEDKVGETTEMTDGIMPIQRNLIDYDKHTFMFDKEIHKETGLVVDNPGTNWYSTVGPIAVKENGTYCFTAPKGIAAPRVAFYDANDAYLGQFRQQGEELYDVMITTPPGTTHVRIAAGDVRLKSESTVDGVENWVFKQVFNQ